MTCLLLDTDINRVIDLAIEESVVLLDMAIPTAALLKLLLILPGGRVQEEEEEMIVETEIQG